jgi:DCN1-like protein 1/2
MKAQLPELRRKLNSDPEYFKKVYQHVFDLSKAPGARTLVLEQGESKSLRRVIS